MAIKNWVGNAHAVRQIDKVTIANTWAGTDTATLTINTKDLVVTVGTGTATSDVANSIRDAWNAAQRIDGTGVNTNTSNFGGQEFGEFAEIDAIVYSTEPSVVYFIAKKAGVPFTLTATESTGGTGTATRAGVQTCTGPHHWDNADNWFTAVVPADGDTAIFKDGNVSVKYGLPSALLNITIIQYQSYTGEIGLRPTNRDNPSKPYREYRTRVVSLGDSSGADGSNTHIFGLGEGLGSSWINITQVNQAASPGGQTTSVVVYNTGAPQSTGEKALNILINNEGVTGGSVTINKGSVAMIYVDSANRCNFPTLNINYTTNQASDADVHLENHIGNLTINQSGGRLLITENGTVSLSGTRTLNLNGGECTISSLATSGGITATVLNSRLVYNTTKTITTLIVGTKGVLDAEKDARAFTITNTDLYEGATLLDEYARITHTNGVDLNRCGVDDVTIRVGNNRRLTLGTAA